MAAEDIYGPALESVKGKTVRCQPLRVESDVTNVHTIASISTRALARGHFDGGNHVRQCYSFLCPFFSEDQVRVH